MSGVRRTLNTLHSEVIGQPWFLAAISVAGLWGIWRGLVQRQATAAITGLLATVGLMLCALVVLARPNDTVGHASRLANDASLGLLAAATAQPLDRPSRSLSEAAQGVFDSLIRDPWCALQFGSVVYCDEPTPSIKQSGTVADAWLAHPPGSDERDLEFQLLKGDAFYAKDHEDPARVRLQEASGTFTRFAILGLVAVGLLGACALLAYLGIRLLLASVLALMLLLFAPAMLLAPAFGESGRATFIAWGKRLVGTLAAKLAYALFLAVVLTGAAMLRRLDVGWFGTWLLQIAFWWGVLFKRHELIGFVSVKSQPERSVGMASSLAHAYYAMQFGRSARSAAAGLAHKPARAASALAAGGRKVRGAHGAKAAATAAEEFDGISRTALEAQYEQAATLVAGRRQAQRELRVIDRRLTGYDEQHAAARAAGRSVPLPNGDQASLLRKRRELLDTLAAPEGRAAEQTLAHTERNRAQTGEAVTNADLSAYRRRRAQDLASNLPTDDDRHVRAAGVDPAVLRAATPEKRDELLAKVDRHLARERSLLERLPAEPDQQRELRIDPDRARASRRRDRSDRARPKARP
jgi:hypothetical protein